MATTYGQYSSPEQQQMWSLVYPWLSGVYQGKSAGAETDLWSTPNVAEWLPDYTQYQPNKSDYVAGGDNYANYYNQVAPAYLNAYSDVLDKTKSSLANTGTLGSNYGGISGAAADVLTDKAGEYAATINKDVAEQIQPFLTSAYGTDAGFGSNAYSTTANALNKYYEEYMKEQQYPYEQLGSLTTSAYPTTTSTTTSSGGK